MNRDAGLTLRPRTISVLYFLSKVALVRKVGSSWYLPMSKVLVMSTQKSKRRHRCFISSAYGLVLSKPPTQECVLIVHIQKRVFLDTEKLRKFTTIAWVKARLPVRSALYSQCTGGLVVR